MLVLQDYDKKRTIKKEDLEFYKSKLNIENKEKHHIVNQYNNLVKSVENDLKRRFEDNLKGINISILFRNDFE